MPQLFDYVAKLVNHADTWMHVSSMLELRVHIFELQGEDSKCPSLLLRGSSYNETIVKLEDLECQRPS